MFLGDCSVLWVNVAEDKVQLDVVATLVRTEHNRVWSFVVELQGMGIYYRQVI